MAVALVAAGFGYANGSTSAGNIGSAISGTPSSKTFSYTATTTGNAVTFWVVMVPSGTSPTTCSLSATGWTFTQIGGIIDGGASAGVGAMFRAYAPNTSAATITMTWNQATNLWFSDFTVECSGADTTNFISASNVATGTGTPTVSVTPLSNDCLVVVFANDSVTAVGTIGGITATKGVDDTQQDWSEYRLLSGGSGVAQSCTVTGSGSYLIGAVAIQQQLVGPTIGSVPSGTALATPAFTSKFLFFDTGDYSPGV